MTQTIALASETCSVGRNRIDQRSYQQEAQTESFCWSKFLSRRLGYSKRASNLSQYNTSRNNISAIRVNIGRFQRLLLSVRLRPLRLLQHRRHLRPQPC
ncbi:hypothetical protein FRC18_010368 [Serendipita sp. 400]|nr:hypothetical protein FRC18_010368 [Serendipita sp. 400]